jgi:hypothetical protein
MKNVQIVNIAPSIPKPIRFLEDLVRNAWWCWNQEAQQLLQRIDPKLWAEFPHPQDFLPRSTRSLLIPAS